MFGAIISVYLIMLNNSVLIFSNILRNLIHLADIMQLRFLLITISFIISLSTKAQLRDSLNRDHSFKSAVLAKRNLAPLALLSAGIYTIHGGGPFNREEVKRYKDENYPDFESYLEDFTEFAPAALVFALPATGLKPKNDFWNRTPLYLKSGLLTMGVTYVSKALINEKRPYIGVQSFPSGHTALAFASATFLHKEYGHLSPLISIAGYATAVQVGVYRILNKRHWVSDVLAGAAVGIFCTNIVYSTHKFRWKKWFGIGSRRNKVHYSSMEKKKNTTANLTLIPQLSSNHKGMLMVINF